MKTQNIIDVGAALLLGLCIVFLLSSVGYGGDTKLYVTPDDKKEEVAPEPEPVLHDFPSTIEGDNAKGVMVVIGFDGCKPCERLKESEPKKLDGSPVYRVLFVQYDEPDKNNTQANRPNWDKLREKAGLDASYPAIVIMKNGDIVDSWTGFKPWLSVVDSLALTRIEKDRDADPVVPFWRRFFSNQKRLR